jgi:outer membrane immunogenic protein
VENKMQKGTMRRSWLALAALGGATILSGAAGAADLTRPVYKAPPAGVLPAAYDWTGFYIGGHVGYGWGQQDWRDSIGLFDVNNKSNGFLGGGQAGFNYQINQFVLGVEGDFSWMGMNGGSNANTVLGAAPIGATFNTNVDWTATMTGRLGVAFDRWLVYGKGGVAWAHDKFSTTAYTFPGTVDFTDTRLGWTVGGGVEYAFAPNWSAKAEYDYLRFGDRDVSFAPGTSTNINQDIHEIKFGINYKFGIPGAVTARY